jgi:hypothetical protein
MSPNILEDDPFWGDQPNVLLHTGRLIEFFPTRDQTVQERLNAISRLVLYIGVCMSVVQGKLTPLQLSGLGLAAIYVMWRNQSLLSLEGFDHKGAGSGRCTAPSRDNPFMNYMPGDPADKPPACKGPFVEEQASNLLNAQLYDNVEDLFERQAGQRQFHTMPVTERVNDRDKYAKWLFEQTTGCKLDGKCQPYEDLRLGRQLIPEDIAPGDFGA